LSFDELLQEKDNEFKQAVDERRRREAQTIQLLVTLIDSYDRSLRTALGMLRELKDVEIVRERPGAPQNGWVEAAVVCRCHTALIDIRMEAAFAWEVSAEAASTGAGRVEPMRVCAARRRSNHFTDPVVYQFAAGHLSYPNCGVDVRDLDQAIRDAIGQLPPEIP